MKRQRCLWADRATRVYTREQAAEILGVGVGSIFAMLRRGGYDYTTDLSPKNIRRYIVPHHTLEQMFVWGMGFNRDGRTHGMWRGTPRGGDGRWVLRGWKSPLFEDVEIWVRVVANSVIEIPFSLYSMSIPRDTFPSFSIDLLEKGKALVNFCDRNGETCPLPLVSAAKEATQNEKVSAIS